MHTKHITGHSNCELVSTPSPIPFQPSRPSPPPLLIATHPSVIPARGARRTRVVRKHHDPLIKGQSQLSLEDEADCNTTNTIKHFKTVTLPVEVAGEAIINHSLSRCGTKLSSQFQVHLGCLRDVCRVFV